MNLNCKSHPEAPKTKSGDYLQIYLSLSYGGSRQSSRTRGHQPGREDHSCSILCNGPASNYGTSEEKQGAPPTTYRRQDLFLYGPAKVSRHHSTPTTSGLRSPQDGLISRQKQGFPARDIGPRLFRTKRGLLQLQGLSTESGQIRADVLEYCESPCQ